MRFLPLGASATAAAATALVAHLHGHALEPRRQLLLRFDDQFDQVTNQVAVLVVEERCGQTWSGKKGKRS